jgi:hypothetical protein
MDSLEFINFYPFLCFIVALYKSEEDVAGSPRFSRRPVLLNVEKLGKVVWKFWNIISQLE